jgi:hypothetical protein
VNPSPVYSTPAASTAPVAVAAPTCTPSGTYVSVVFQPDATATNITEFLKTYNVTMGDGPNADGVYRIRLPQNMPQDQMSQMIDSMRSQTAVVSTVSS